MVKNMQSLSLSREKQQGDPVPTPEGRSVPGPRLKNAPVESLRIAIVNPTFPPSVYTFQYGLEVIGGPVRSSIQTGALPALAGLLDRRHDISVFDESVDPLDLERLKEFDLVAITGMIVQKHRMLELLDALYGKGPVVVVGGALVTCEQTLFEGKCDAVFIGEAEETWPVFVEDLAAGRETQQRYQQADRTDMSKVPVPRFDLLDTRRYGTVSIQFSRGCPFLCEFCDIIVMFGRRPRTKPVAHVLAELDAARAAGFRTCFLVDDNFIGNKAAAKALLHALIAWQGPGGGKMKLTTEASVNLAEDPELLDLMVRAGFTQVFVGIESPNEAALLETRKVQNVRAGSLLDRLDKIRHAGLIVRGGFIVGFDDDSPRIFDDQFDFIMKAAIPIATVSILSPLPTTPLHKRLADENRLVPSDPICGFEPMKMSRDELKAGYQILNRKLYDTDNFFERVFRSFDGPEAFRARLARERQARRAASGPLAALGTVRLALRLAIAAVRAGHARVIPAYLRNWRRNRTLGATRLPSFEFIRLCIIHWHQYRLANGAIGSNWMALDPAP